MSSRKPTDWMWAQACDLLDQAERMHRQFFHLSTAARARATWEPPVDVFEDDDEVLVVVALPGVAPDSIEVSASAGILLVRARSAAPFVAMRGAVRRLEIPYGTFERRIPLMNVRVDAATRELRNGCLLLRLRKES